VIRSKYPFWSTYLLAGLVLLLALGMAGCEDTGRPSDLVVWIDVPVDGTVYPAIVPVNIEGHGALGIESVEVWIDGDLYATIDDMTYEAVTSYFQIDWTPPGEGEYTILVVAHGLSGHTSEPDLAHIRVGGPTLVSEDTPTPVLDITPTPLEPITVTPLDDEPLVEFYAEPAEIAAGDCSTLYWHVENVQQVLFGGVEQPFDGSYRTCTCETEYYNLTVIHLDGSEQRYPAQVSVTGTCATDTPDDNDPPDAPTLYSPSNGDNTGCVGSVQLTWFPVSDDSGIDHFEVQVERHSGDNNWQAVSGSPFSPIDKQMNLPVECGWTYRWRVRAVDGAGNIGPWSSWWSFVVPLT
jgi:hypothetical protein